MKIGKIITVVVSILVVILITYFSVMFPVSEITAFIESMGIIAPLIYILIQIAGQIFAPLSTSALFIAGYVMFGNMAIYYAIIIWLVTSTTNFYISRKYGRSALKLLIGEDGVKKVDGIVEKIDNRSLIILRISTIYINDFASYAFGLTKISYKSFIFSTIVGIIPWAIFLSMYLEVERDGVLLTLFKVFLSMVPFAILSWVLLKKRK